MAFIISGLPRSAFAPLFGLSERELAAHGAVRRVADRRPGFPCRVSLRDAEIGESLLLLNYEHLAVDSPYRSRYAIFVREHAHEYCPRANEIPDVLTSRLLSVRAIDDAGMVLEADVVEGRQLAPLLDRMLENPKSAYLHLHNAKPGCFAARADRA